MTARRTSVLLALLLATVGATVALAAPASAHPLGNATVNSADRLVVTPDTVSITHVLDFAEIPTLQVIAKMDQSRQDLQGFARDRCATDARASVLESAGTLTPLSVVSATAAFTAGQAELQTLRIECQWEAAAAANEGTLTYEAAPVDIAGWREISAVGDRVTLGGSTVPTTTPTDLLQTYPETDPTEVPQTTTAAFTAAAGGASLSKNAVAVTTSDSASLPTDATTRWLSGLVDGATSPLGAFVALILAGIVGAFHALTPGHGKTAVAFAIAGQERSPKAAITVGATVTATHTASVLLLGTLVASTTVLAPASWIPILSVASGLLLLGVGVMLLRRARDGNHGHIHLGHSDHDHPHDQHHDHSHDHRPEHGHANVATAVIARPAVSSDRPSHPRRTNSARATLVALGVAGGVVPSPSALLVLLGAVAIGRPWWGVLLVIAFGIGMAVTLAVAGLLAWQAGERISSWAAKSQHHSVARLVRLFPLGAALGVCGAGIVVMARGLGLL